MRDVDNGKLSVKVHGKGHEPLPGSPITLTMITPEVPEEIPPPLRKFMGCTETFLVH